MIRPLLAVSVLSALALGGCGDEDTSGSPPQVKSGAALCRSLDADHFTLDTVEAVVFDRDGFADPVTHEVYMVVESTRVEVEAVPQEPAAGDGKCDGSTCKMLFRWERSPQSAQFHCGSDGKGIGVDFEIIDPDGISTRVTFSSNPR